MISTLGKEKTTPVREIAEGVPEHHQLNAATLPDALLANRAQNNISTLAKADSSELGFRF